MGGGTKAKTWVEARGLSQGPDVDLIYTFALTSAIASITIVAGVASRGSRCCAILSEPSSIAG